MAQLIRFLLLDFYVSGVGLSCLCILGLFANSLTLYVLNASKEMRKQPINMYLTVLAIYDNGVLFNAILMLGIPSLYKGNLLLNQASNSGSFGTPADIPFPARSSSRMDVKPILGNQIHESSNSWDTLPTIQIALMKNSQNNNDSVSQIHRTVRAHAFDESSNFFSTLRPDNEIQSSNRNFDKSDKYMQLSKSRNLFDQLISIKKSENLVTLNDTNYLQNQEQSILERLQNENESIILYEMTDKKFHHQLKKINQDHNQWNQLPLLKQIERNLEKNENSKPTMNMFVNLNSFAQPLIQSSESPFQSSSDSSSQPSSKVSSQSLSKLSSQSLSQSLSNLWSDHQLNLSLHLSSHVPSKSYLDKLITIQTESDMSTKNLSNYIESIPPNLFDHSMFEAFESENESPLSDLNITNYLVNFNQTTFKNQTLNYIKPNNFSSYLTFDKTLPILNAHQISLNLTDELKQKKIIKNDLQLTDVFNYSSKNNREQSLMNELRNSYNNHLKKNKHRIYYSFQSNNDYITNLVNSKINNNESIVNNDYFVNDKKSLTTDSEISANSLGEIAADIIHHRHVIRSNSETVKSNNDLNSNSSSSNASVDDPSQYPRFNGLFQLVLKIQNLLYTHIQLIYPLALISQTGSIWVTCLITAERYLAVCHPFRALSLSTRNRAFVSLTVVSVLAVLYNLPRFAELHIRFHEQSDHVEVVKSELRLNLIYYWFYYIFLHLALLYVIPLTLLSYLNIQIYIAVRNASKNRSQLTRHQEGELNIATMLLLVVAVFIVCNAPGFVVTVMELCNAPYLQICTIFSNFLACINSSTNFVIYSIFGKKFRANLKEAFTCQNNSLSVNHVNQNNQTLLTINQNNLSHINNNNSFIYNNVNIPNLNTHDGLNKQQSQKSVVETFV